MIAACYGLPIMLALELRLHSDSPTGGKAAESAVAMQPAVIPVGLDAYRIIVVHEHRHFQQAKRVTKETAFPR